ncbi:acyltransferase [Rhabdochromatium marinum]|uniref:acyltransferase n=1 Tax=Rhabdochromatium marinum TaxID=48729 RepID=UPI0019079D82|nr:acyltransferase [Rhabdochromatium marinum]MBK1649873.1 hypothetical protein [Rhabdochromatium marinum]
MKFLANLTQGWLRQGKPKLWASLFRLIYGAHNVRIGHNFRCDGMPRCLVDSSAELIIGDDVEFRSGVEVRVHGSAQVLIEDGSRIDRGVRILASNCAVVRIGAGTRIGLYSVLNGGDSIDLGRKCLVSGFVYLQTSMHRFTSLEAPICDQGYDHGSIQIGDGAWLAAHVVIMPGCTVGPDAVIGSNAVVVHNVDPASVVAGIPARKLHDRVSEK